MVIFSNDTLLSDIIQSNYKSVPKETFKKLKKDTLCDLVVHLINENKVLGVNFNADVMIEKMSSIINQSISQIPLKEASKCSDEAELTTEGKLDQIERNVSTMMTQVSNIERNVITAQGDKILSKSHTDQQLVNNVKDNTGTLMRDINEKNDEIQETDREEASPDENVSMLSKNLLIKIDQSLSKVESIVSNIPNTIDVSVSKYSLTSDVLKPSKPQTSLTSNIEDKINEIQIQLNKLSNTNTGTKPQVSTAQVVVGETPDTLKYFTFEETLKNEMTELITNTKDNIITAVNNSGEAINNSISNIKLQEEEAINHRISMKQEVTEAIKRSKEDIDEKVTAWNTDLKTDIGKLNTTKDSYAQKLTNIEENTKATNQKTSNVRKELVKMNLRNERSQIMNGKEGAPGALQGRGVVFDQQKTVLIKGIRDKQYFANSIGLRRNLSKIFPLIAIDIAMTTTSGFVQYQFRTKEDADKVMQNWDSNNFGGGTKAIQPQAKTSIGIARDVPIDYTEEELSAEIKENYGATEVKRLLRNEKPLPLLKVFFDTPELLQQAMASGIKLKEGLLIHVEESTHRGGRIIRCYNCQKFGHVQARCTNSLKCVKCGEEGHRHQDNGDQKCTKDIKCSNCGEQHQANSYLCSKFKEIRQMINSNGRFQHSNRENASAQV